MSHWSFQYFSWSFPSSMINAWQWILCHFASIKQMLVHPIDDATFVLECELQWSLIFWLMDMINSVVCP
jgi:hypothetical protein